MRSHHEDRLRHARHSNDGDSLHRRTSAVHDEIELAPIDAERQEINTLFREGKLNDEGRRHIERELDLREAQLRNTRGE
jgi:CPA1 family monovalent cation:H+ antiporter